MFLDQIPTLRVYVIAGWTLKIAHIVTHVIAQRADKGRVHHLVFSGGLGLFCLCSFLLLPIGHGFL